MVSTPTVAQAAAQLLERCRQEKHLSIAGVAAALGYRSPNSVERIAKGSAGQTACCKFLESARRVYPELFPGEDGGSVHGRAAENAWLRLMRGERGPAEASTRLYRADGMLLGSIGEYYAGMGAASVRALMLNGLNRPLTADLLALARLPGAQVEQCLTRPCRRERLTRASLDMLPLFFCEGYRMTQATGTGPEAWGLAHADVMLVACGREGETPLDMICFTGPGKAMLLPLPGDVTPDRLGLAFMRERETVAARKDPEFQEDYARYLAWCAALEASGPIRQIKEDVGLEQIPTPVLGRALHEGVPAAGDEADALMIAVREMAQICSERWQAWQCRRRTHTQLMRLTALWQFVKTGLMTDHAWCFRAFSPGERMTILRGLKRACAGKRYRLLFLPEEYWQGPGEIACYGSTQLSVIGRETDYNLSGGHAEILLTDRTVVASFIRFFDEELLPLCLPESETLRILDEMLQYLAQCKAQEDDG